MRIVLFFVYTIVWLILWGGCYGIIYQLHPAEDSQTALWLSVAAYGGAGGIVICAIALRHSAQLRAMRVHVTGVEEALQLSETGKNEYRAMLKEELTIAPVPLALLVNTAKEKIAPLLKEKNQRFSVSLPREEIVLDADSARLSQSLCVLLYHVLEASAEKSTITLLSEREGAVVILEIGNAFAAFAHGIPAANKLAYARIMVELHGGQMRMDVPKGKFTLWLPLAFARQKQNVLHQALHAESAGGTEEAARRIG